MESLLVQVLQQRYAQNNNFAGLVLETPFTSMIEAAKNFYPYIPVALC